MDISAKERCVRVIGQRGYNLLEDAGLMVEYQQERLDHMAMIPKGSYDVIGTVYDMDDERAFLFIDEDINGYKILQAESDGFVYVTWRNKSNMRRLT